MVAIRMSTQPAVAMRTVLSLLLLSVRRRLPACSWTSALVMCSLRGRIRASTTPASPAAFTCASLLAMRPTSTAVAFSTTGRLSLWVRSMDLQTSSASLKLPAPRISVRESRVSTASTAHACSCTSALFPRSAASSTSVAPAAMAFSLLSSLPMSRRRAAQPCSCMSLARCGADLEEEPPGACCAACLAFSRAVGGSGQREGRRREGACARRRRPSRWMPPGTRGTPRGSLPSVVATTIAPSAAPALPFWGRLLGLLPARAPSSSPPCAAVRSVPRALATDAL